jgi:hypothetical protein
MAWTRTAGRDPRERPLCGALDAYHAGPGEAQPQGRLSGGGNFDEDPDRIAARTHANDELSEALTLLGQVQPK